MKILIDTSVIIDYLRRKDKEYSFLYSLASSDNELFVSILTHSELYSGKSVWEKKEARKTMEEIVSGFTIINLTQEISITAGKIKAKYNMDLFDAIIAATAIKGGLSLATLNIKDFEKIQDLKFYSTETPV